MKYWIYILACIFTYNSFSQVPSIEWQHCYGGTHYDEGFKTARTSDNGYIFFGETHSSDGDVNGYHVGNCGALPCSDFWLIKTDSIGSLQWQKCLGGTNDEYTTSVIVDTADNINLLGLTLSSDGDINNNHGSADSWLVELDDSGGILFNRCFGGTNFDGAFRESALVRNGKILCGNTNSTNGDVSGNHGMSDIWLVRLDTVGTILWQKCIGGSQNEYSYQLLRQSDNEFFMIGEVYSVDGDITSVHHGGSDFWICKLDSSGNIIWQKSYGGSANDIVRKAQLAPYNNGLILVGSTSSNDGDILGNHGYNDFWIVRLDSVGNLLWQKCLGGSFIDDGFDIDTTADRGFLAAGITSSYDGDVLNSVDSFSFNAWVVKLDSGGNIQWQKTLGGTDIDLARSVIHTNDDGCLLLGYTASNDMDVTGNHGNADFWAVKLSSPYVDVPKNHSIAIDLKSTIDSENKILFIEFYSVQCQEMKIELYEMNGKRKLAEVRQMEVGINNENISLDNLNNGIYILMLSNERMRVCIKVPCIF